MAAAVNAPFTVTRSSTFFERVSFSVSGVPSGWTAALNAPSLFGWSADAGSVRVTAPSSASPGTYHVRVTGRNWGARTARPHDQRPLRPARRQGPRRLGVVRDQHRLPLDRVPDREPPHDVAGRDRRLGRDRPYEVERA